MKTENLSTLTIHKMSREQFDREKAAGRINDNEIYLTPDEGGNSVGSLIDLGVTATAAELNILDGVTATTTEINYVKGVTSNIQTQLNTKADKTELGALAWCDVVASTSVTHGKDLLSLILETYILNIDYNTLLAFDTSEIVTGATSTTSVLGQAILGQMVLA